MTQERADEIVRKVIYARLNVMPKIENSDNACGHIQKPCVPCS